MSILSAIKLKFIRESSSDWQPCQLWRIKDELIDRFGEYPDVVAYLLVFGLAKAYLNKVFANRVERKNNKLLVIQFEKYRNNYFLHKIISRLFRQIWRPIFQKIKV